MSEKENNGMMRDDAIPLDKEIDREGLITESYEPESKAAYHHSHHHSEHSHHHRSGHHHSGHHHSHHSSHHGHRHRSGSTRKKNQNKRSFKEFLKKNKKRLIYTVLAVVFFLCAVVSGVYLDRLATTKTDTDKTADNFQNTEGKLIISVPTFDGEVSVVGSAAQAYLKGEEGVTVHDIYERYKGSSYRLDISNPVTLSYEIKGAPKDYAVKNAEFVVSEDASYSNPIVVQAEKKDTSVPFYNLKSGTKYFYRIDIYFTNDTVSSVSGQFRTAAGPRLMAVDGVCNMRDVGGWTTVDGRVVRQGLLYRGCELDGAVADQYTITKEGINTMLKDLGIKTDMDLRLDSENPHDIDILGGNVEHVHYSTQMYTSIFNMGENREKIRVLFSDLADKNQYPAYIHCTYGRDRTGTVCYLLGALLGVPHESLIKDYELSALYHGYVETEKMNEFVERINQLPGATLSDKVAGYLLTIGVTEEEIESIREIFLG